MMSLEKMSFQKICGEWEGVDILINNAGISYRSVIEHMSSKDESLQMATNYFGPMSIYSCGAAKYAEKRSW